MPRMTLDEMRDLAVRVFLNSKTSEENARIVADGLVAAEADGMPSHGLSRIPAYADQAMAGKVDGFAEPKITWPAGASMRVDAKSGFAMPAIKAGLARAADSISDTGTVAVAIGNSHHSGVAGHHVEAMAQRGLIALSVNNSPAGIAPWGGNRALYGTNPIAFACPVPDDDPIVVDLSLSKVARGKVKLAADKGEAIPEGWAVDADGNPTTDAKAAMGGSMVPMGDAKGAALVMVVELLAVALTGSNYGFEATSFFDDKGPSPNVGQFFLVFDPAAFGGDGVGERITSLVQAIDEQPGARLPGRRRFDIRRAADTDGVEVADGVHQELLRRAGA